LRLLARKYESISYRLTLLNAGAILQTLYLVCADLRVGCCALGTGDSKVFEAATGIDAEAHPAVLEIAIAGFL